MSRRGGHDEGGAHGGSWKIALADLMTVLMVFFLVMWLLAVVDPKERKIFAESLTGQYEEPIAVVESSAKQDGSELNPLDLKPPATEAEIRETLKSVNPRDIDIEDGPDFTKITLRSDSFFESGRATVSDKTREQLEQLGESLAGRGQPMVISGFTDDLPISNFQFPSNWELSAARAATVARTFIYMGVDKNLLTIEGKADNEAVVPNDSAYSRSMNRRVVIKIDKRPQSQQQP
ncbi:MAG: flagellar motor protein MotB [Thiomicrorhabdus chilensis]|uniref:OmpA/MotB family protein n=1 Tax=Thiomicrorhabdus chilensis TaxID=63656 RepID=UPI00299EF8CB|nr:flagellar motor protein MotB [Thiomicrorhabdus chilensis]MDX1347166.1 flagellar motor protein MotB [Thiomicrorhabdus chilensis]